MGESVSVRIDADVAERLRVIRERDRRPMSAVIGSALDALEADLPVVSPETVAWLRDRAASKAVGAGELMGAILERTRQATEAAS